MSETREPPRPLDESDVATAGHWVNREVAELIETLGSEMGRSSGAGEFSKEASKALMLEAIDAFGAAILLLVVVGRLSKGSSRDAMASWLKRRADRAGEKMPFHGLVHDAYSTMLLGQFDVSQEELVAMLDYHRKRALNPEGG